MYLAIRIDSLNILISTYKIIINNNNIANNISMKKYIFILYLF